MPKDEFGDIGAQEFSQVGFAGHYGYAAFAAMRASCVITTAEPARRFSGIRPVAHEDDALVGPDLRQRALLADVAHQPGRIGELAACGNG